MNPTSSQPGVNGGQKVLPVHRQRLACIYVRQSTLKQVRENKESQINQYRLVERAQALGWPEARIRVIDADLGLSAKSSAGRLGFQELVSLVSLGKVGIVFGYEVSRLARNNSDWYHLLDLAATIGVLIADNDGVYDPRLFNDRLLLGLKGTMSEAELHFLRQRLDAGRMNKIKRAEYRQPLPTGLLRLRDGTVIKDPDEQVRTVVQWVLDKFVELGSCTKVVRYLRKQNILLPRRQSGGIQHGDLLWKPPAYAAVYAIIRNPAYAGAFAHGRCQADAAKRLATGRTDARTPKPMEEWIHIQQDIYPAYISWKQFLANQEQLRHNGAEFDKNSQGPQGAVREGKALLQGLVRCGGCGGPLHVIYKETPRYACFQRPTATGEGSCLHINAPRVDAAVVQAFFAAIQPAQLDALQAWLTQQAQERQQLDKQWQQRIQRIRYQAQLAERHYRAVDPDNRLVASTLERQWEEQLQQLEDTQTTYTDFLRQTNSPQLSAEQQDLFRHLCDTLPALWPSLPNDHKKQLLRSLISQVILTPAAPNQVEVKIVWVSGHYSLIPLLRAYQRWEDVPTYPAMLQRIRQLWEQGLNDQSIADQLHQEGFPAFYEGARLSRHNISDLRRKQGWSVRLVVNQTSPLLDGCYTTHSLAGACHTDPIWIRNRIHDGTIDPDLVTRHPQHNCLLIHASPELIDQLSLLATQTKRRQRRKSHPVSSPLPA
ncbi:MAG: recombinase family protein [Anaerolineae bacterium]